GLRLSGTDLDIAVSTTVPAEVDTEGAVTLPAKKLVDIVRELPGGPVRVTAAGEARVSLECGRSKFKLLGLPREELPSFPAAEIEIAKSDNHLGFRAGGTLVFSRLIEGPYPNYEQVIPRENDKAATVDKAATTGALRRMSVVASDQTHRIRLAFAGGTVKFSVQTPDLGEAQDELPVTYEGEPLEIGFNAMYLLEILKYMPT